MAGGKRARRLRITRADPSTAATLTEPLFALVERFAASFAADRSAFERSLELVLADESAWLGIAEAEPLDSTPDPVGYCLGFAHPAFYANGSVAWVEEIMVREDMRGQAVGRRLMEAFEEWAAGRGCRLVALATRRAAPFYAALGYEESAAYFRKLLPEG